MGRRRPCRHDRCAVAPAATGTRSRAGDGWRARLGQALDGIAHTFDLVRDFRAGLLALLGMAIYWAADIFVLWACLALFWPHGNPGVLVIVLGYASGYALTRRSLPLAGAGAVEMMLPFALIVDRHRATGGDRLRLRLPRVQPLAAACACGGRRLRVTPQRRRRLVERHQASRPFLRDRTTRQFSHGAKACSSSLRPFGASTRASTRRPLRTKIDGAVRRGSARRASDGARHTRARA
jgi:hypothetical protein